MQAIALLALVTASIFFGASVYVSMVEHPARLGLNDDMAWSQWGPSYQRGLLMQSSLAIVAGVLGLAAWWIGGGAAWLVGALLMLANWPYTLAIIMPVNKQLEVMTLPVPPQARALLVRWGRFHAGRTALSALCVLLYVVALYPPV